MQNEGILARDLVQEQKLMNEIFQEFFFHSDTGAFIPKSETQIVEFMTEIVPRFRNRIYFTCPHILLDQSIHD